MLRFSLPEKMVAVIGKALGAQPHDLVRDVVDEMQKQINEQQAAALVDAPSGTEKDKA